MVDKSTDLHISLEEESRVEQEKSPLNAKFITFSTLEPARISTISFFDLFGRLGRVIFGNSSKSLELEQLYSRLTCLKAWNILSVFSIPIIFSKRVLIIFEVSWLFSKENLTSKESSQAQRPFEE